MPGASLVRTVGWFTAVFPAMLEIGPKLTPKKQLQSIKDNLRGVPSHGLGYGLLRYFSKNSDQKEQLEALPQPEILFNYLGDMQSLWPNEALFQLTDQLRLSRCPENQRRYLLEVNAAIINEQLCVDWSYNPQIHQPTTVQRWADGLMNGLRSLMDQCLASESDDSDSRKPTDFPLAQLNAEKLDKIAALLNRVDNQ